MTSKWYRVNLKPLEFYYFAKEVGSRLRSQDSNLEVPYYVVSDEVPSQTTLLGVMRYYVLKRKDCLSKKCLSNRDSLIGKTSFNYRSKNRQLFGQIEELTPLIIRHDETGRVIVPCPMNIVQREGRPHIYKKSSVDASLKKDIYKNYISLFPDEQLFCTDSELFHRAIKTRNNKLKDEDALFKIEMKKLNKNYSFSFFIKVSDEFEVHKGKEIVFLGGNKSAFSIELHEVADDTYDNEIKYTRKMLYNIIREECWYAISDVYYAIDDDNPKKFASLSKVKGQRNLETNVDRIADSAHRYKCNNLVTLFKAGSIFYEDPTKWINNDNAKHIGLNQILKLEKIGE